MARSSISTSLLADRYGKTSVRDEGKTAYHQGVPQTRCPYNDMDRQRVWMDGWKDAQKEDEAN